MSETYISHLAEAVNGLLAAAGVEVRQASEDEREFTWTHPTADPADLHGLTALSPFLDVFAITIRYTLQQWEGSAELCPGDRLKITRGALNPALTPEPLDPSLVPLYDQVIAQLGQNQGSVDLNQLAVDLSALQQGGAALALTREVYLNKRPLAERLTFPPERGCMFFILAEKFCTLLAKRNFTALEDLWNPGRQETAPAALVLLGDSRGRAGSPSGGILVLGLDQWAIEPLPPEVDERFTRTAAEALAFNQIEADWEMAPTTLTPHHFFLKPGDLSSSNVIAALNRCCAQASVVFLANRVSLLPGKELLAEFHGHQRLKIQVPLDSSAPDPTPLYNLFAWTYENSSSDKLAIARQIVAYQLGDDPAQNYTRLTARASAVLQNARDNFQYYLRKGVEEYFAKRLKLVEFVEKFSEDTGEAVSKLTSDLIGDLYKTVGVVLGVVLAALVSPHSTPAVIRWTSLLYLLYIVFILAYALPSVYLRFAGGIRRYESNKREMAGILSADEIQKAEDQSYPRALWIFRVYFALTNILYASLGAVAFTLFRAAI